MMKPIISKAFVRRTKQLLSLVFTGFAVAALGWFGDLLKEGQGGVVDFLPNCGGWWGYLIFSFVLFLLFSGFAYKFGRSLIPLRHLSRGGEPKPHQVLIMPLSPLQEDPIPKPGDIEINQNASQALAVTLECGTLQEALEKLKEKKLNRWNGENFLLALQAHQTALTQIVLIYSTSLVEEKRARDQVNFERIARHFFPCISITSTTTDFENISSLYDLMTDTIERLMLSNFKSQDIMLDCTGGFKATSIAAALATLHYEQIEVQYVHTDKRKVLAYNMQTQPNTRSN